MANKDTLTDFLYDKIIDVELIRSVRDKQLVAILEEDSQLPIAIYTGFTHVQYTRGVGNKAIPSTVKVVGPTLSYQPTPDDLGKNRWWQVKSISDNIIQNVRARSLGGYTAGCLITVTVNGKTEKYHATYLKKDGYTTGLYHILETTSIKCPRGGLKPSISFTTNVIPGDSCYKMTLKLTNLNLDYDIREVQWIKITAGYRMQDMQEAFMCPVYSSYIESPNPDGITTFECLCTGYVDSVMGNRPVTFRYRGGKLTIQNFIDAIGKGLGLVVENHLLDTYNALNIHISGTSLAGKETYAENAAATITWARKIIQKCIASSEGFNKDAQLNTDKTYPYIHMHIFNGTLVVYALNKRNKDSDKIQLTSDYDVTVLDAIKGASFNGTALTVKTAWNPRVKPGNIIKMMPRTYNGANLPNVLDRKQFGDDEDNNYYYRVITQSIAFDTTGDTNEMALLALPIVYMEDEDSAPKQAAIQSWSDYITQAQSTYDTRGAYTVTFGDAEEGDMQESEAAKNTANTLKNTNDMFSLNILNYFPNTVDYTILPNDTLSEIAEKMYARGKGYCDFKIVPENRKALGAGDWGNDFDSRAFMWPIIAVATYNRAKALNQTTQGIGGYETIDNLKNPQIISKGNKLVIPVIPDFQTLQKVKDVFLYAYNAWITNFPSYGNWGMAWKRVYKYLGGTIDG